MESRLFTRDTAVDMINITNLKNLNTNNFRKNFCSEKEITDCKIVKQKKNNLENTKTANKIFSINKDTNNVKDDQKKFKDNMFNFDDKVMDSKKEKKYR